MQDQYFVVERENDDQHVLLEWAQDKGEYGLGRPLQYSGPVQFEVGEPIPKNIVWVDYHKAPEPVISQRLAETLTTLGMYGAELFPVEIRNPREPFAVQSRYCLLHIWNQIACLDRDRSQFRQYKNGAISFIKKLVLAEPVLREWDLEKRQLFVLAEKTSVILVHQDLKERLLALAPVGLRFFPVSQWYRGIAATDLRGA